MVTRFGAILRGSASSGTSWRRVARSLWHFAQMVLAMWGGMALYHGLQRTALAQTGFAAWALAHPLVDFWLMVAAMTLPMVAVMAIHRHGWRYCAEMTAAMLAPLALLSVLAATDLLSNHILHGASEPVMVLSMAGYALYRSGKRARGVSPRVSAQTRRTAANEVSVPVVDLNCAGCALAVEKAVGALAGVESVTVNLASKRAHVRGITTIESVRRALEQAGFEIVKQA